MEKHRAGDVVRGGFYLNTSRWNLEVVQGKNGVLKGDGGTFVRIPLVLLCPLVLALSGAFVVFLPVVGFLLVIQTLMGGLGKFLVKTCVFTPALGAPGEAYLIGHEPKNKDKKTTDYIVDENIEDIKEEIRVRRALEDNKK